MFVKSSSLVWKRSLVCQSVSENITRQCCRHFMLRWHQKGAHFVVRHYRVLRFLLNLFCYKQSIKLSNWFTKRISTKPIFHLRIKSVDFKDISFLETQSSELFAQNILGCNMQYRKLYWHWVLNKTIFAPWPQCSVSSIAIYVPCSHTLQAFLYKIFIACVVVKQTCVVQNIYPNKRTTVKRQQFYR